MSSAFITVRTRKRGGKSYVVRFRRGGRGSKLVHAGAFGRMEHARTRRDFIIGELAAGRDPLASLAAALETPAAPKTLDAWADEYEASRVDVTAGTAKNLRAHLARIRPAFGDRDPATVGWQDVQGWVGALTGDGERPLKPSSVRRYVETFRLLLDFCEVQPNPARDRRVKLPPVTDEEPDPPTGRQFLAILDAVPARWVLPFITIEQTAMTVGETAALAWGDVDVAESRFRLRRATVKGAIRARARWEQVPAWLMDALQASCPFEDRTAGRRVFAFTEASARSAMRRACKAAGIPHFHPHDLRHRRITLWHHAGIPTRALAERAGHAQATTTLNVYSDVMDPGKVPDDELERRVSAVAVRSP